MKNFWILNPDAELELAALAHEKPGAYTAPEATRVSMNERRSVFDELTLGDPALLAHELGRWSSRNEDELPALLWCPTPSLLARCRKRRIRVPQSPPASLLLAVNDKARLSNWGLPVVPGRTLLDRVEDLKELHKDHAILRLKRPFGFAGRGQRRITAELSADDARWISAGLRAGPVVVEPELFCVQLRSVHLLVHRDERLVGEPLGFVCDEFGAFERWETRTTVCPEDETLRFQAGQLAERLFSAGYFGPAAIDFAICGGGNVYALDLNGRFSLGWSRGMGVLRERALVLHKSQGS